MASIIDGGVVHDDSHNERAARADDCGVDKRSLGGSRSVPAAGSCCTTNSRSLGHCCNRLKMLFSERSCYSQCSGLNRHHSSQLRHRNNHLHHHSLIVLKPDCL